MKTEISRFCETTLNVLSAFPPTLEKAATRMEEGHGSVHLETPLATLNELRARLRSLMDKLGNQHAYLLIFGPLKSGKSTLMNAISGAYVSEVTSLPGYPCLVYVQHSEEAHFSVTRYNGRESVFSDGGVLKHVIADSHVALAQQIRSTEQHGEEFDPRTHFTEAIRRIDIKVPVPSLAESNTVLVDTPGLYSRMNFGYDMLTREFRNSAACAVFVVKTDNLFLEQVFAEFNQLLNLFSRIFLVINVDSGKRDLQPDGSLQPSAESQNPEQIIEAFATLSMAGPLRQAYEEERVRIHAIDLLSAASVFLTRDGSEHGSLTGVAEKQKKAFEVFLQDLTNYLNSTDYTLEFLRDSLRQGYTICGEVHGIFDGAELGALREKQNALEEELRDFDGRITALDRLLAVDWDATFENVRTESAMRTVQGSTAKAAQVAKEMRGALNRWYSGNDSLKRLQEQHWNPMLIEAARALAGDSRSRLRNLLDTPLGGSEPAALVMNDLHTVGFRLGPIALAASPKLNAEEDFELYPMTINEQEVPVRKSLADWLLFRKVTTVRRRLFGEQLSEQIAPEMKGKRLPESSREAFHKMIDAAVIERFPSFPAKFADTLLTGYVTKFRTDVLNRLRQQREELLEQRADRQEPFDANASVLASMQELNDLATEIAGDLNTLAQREQMAPLAADVPVREPRAEPERVEKSSIDEPAVA
ncbi:MAG: dynamin family protein [Verrucomicrobiota bacterium]|nr:dynamin family protein [Verrucomicrobiota bacterium]